MFKIKKEDAALLFDVHKGLKSSREFIRGYSRMYLDVSKGVVKVDCAINPTIQFAFVGKNLVDMNGWFVIRSSNGDAVIVTVSDDVPIDRCEDHHIKTRELLKIREYIGREGEDVTLKLDNGLIFSRRDGGKCSIELEGVFKIVVTRLSVSKRYVKFEGCGTYDYIYVSRTKHMPF